MSKGSNRRPEDSAAIESNWDRIFSGRGRMVKAADSKPASIAGSSPAASAIHNATGEATTADMETN